jgi:hypothetical protein
VEVAWLACAVGNDRAARFYEKYAWRRVGTMSYQPDAAADVPALQVWRYEKRLDPPVPQSDGAERRQPVRVG